MRPLTLALLFLLILPLLSACRTPRPALTETSAAADSTVIRSAARTFSISSDSAACSTDISSSEITVEFFPPSDSAVLPAPKMIRIRRTDLRADAASASLTSTVASDTLEISSASESSTESITTPAPTARSPTILLLLLPAIIVLLLQQRFSR